MLAYVLMKLVSEVEVLFAMLADDSRASVLLLDMLQKST